MFLVEKVIDIVDHAGNLVLNKLQSGFTVSQKGRIDLVTDADRGSEEYIVQQLRKEFPGHSIVGEENGRHEMQGSDYVWYIDPLDGTTNYVHRVPYFAVSVALAHKGEIILGVVYNPASGERFTAEKEKGSFLNGSRIRVSETECLEQSLLVTGFPYDIRTTERDNMAEFARVTKRSQGVRRTGSAALDLCHVACGRFDGYWEANVNVWDIAAGSLIVTEAGGKVTNCLGETLDVHGREVLASNGVIHAELVAAVGS